MERYLAVDNVCAWPNLCRMPDGRLVATIFNQPCHGKWEGDVEVWESGDEGRSWTLCSVPAPHEPETIRMNVAAGLAADGDFIVIASGWGGEDFRGRILPAWVCRSSDGGRSWTRTETFPPPEGQSHIVPFGKIIQLPDGVLGVSGYSSHRVSQTDRNRCWFLTSRDDGRTWGEAAPIAEDHNECDVLCLSDGRLFAAARMNYEGALTLFISEDDGQTWARDRQLTGAKEHPAHLLELEPGKVLLTYGIRHRGYYGVGARFTEDGGEKWYTPMALASFDGAWDGGYPSTACLPDGTLVTAYYASGNAAHQRYHMGVIRWRLMDAWQRNGPPA